MSKEIIVISKDDEIETWGSLTTICKNHKEFKYHTIKKLKFPFTHKDWKFKKLKYNQLNNN